MIVTANFVLATAVIQKYTYVSDKNILKASLVYKISTAVKLFVVVVVVILQIIARFFKKIP